MHVFGLWEEIGVTGENLRKPKHAHTHTHRKVPARWATFLLWDNTVNYRTTVSSSSYIPPE